VGRTQFGVTCGYRHPFTDGVCAPEFVEATQESRGGFAQAAASVQMIREFQEGIVGNLRRPPSRKRKPLTDLLVSESLPEGELEDGVLSIVEGVVRWP
jgi:hypothetical protein